jgi:hypothetical protein
VTYKERRFLWGMSCHLREGKFVSAYCTLQQHTCINRAILYKCNALQHLFRKFIHNSCIKPIGLSAYATPINTNVIFSSQEVLISLCHVDNPAFHCFFFKLHDVIVKVSLCLLFTAQVSLINNTPFQTETRRPAHHVSTICRILECFSYLFHCSGDIWTRITINYVLIAFELFIK